MCIDLVKARTWLRSLNTTAKCGTILPNVPHFALPLFAVPNFTPATPPPTFMRHSEAAGVLLKGGVHACVRERAF